MYISVVVARDGPPCVIMIIGPDVIIARTVLVHIT